MPYVVTPCAFKIHRRSRGKPVLICIMACWLLNAVVIRKSPKSPFKKLSQWYRCFVVSLRVVAENVVTETDGRTDRETEKPSTVTLAAHAHRGLTNHVRYHISLSFFMHLHIHNTGIIFIYHILSCLKPKLHASLSFLIHLRIHNTHWYDLHLSCCEFSIH